MRPNAIKWKVPSGSPLIWLFILSMNMCSNKSVWQNDDLHRYCFLSCTIIFSNFKFLFTLCVSLFCFDPKGWRLCHFVIKHQYFDGVLFSLGFRGRHNMLFPWNSLCLGLFCPQVQRGDLIRPLWSWYMSSLVYKGILWFYYYSFPPFPNPCSHSLWVPLSTTMVWYQRVSLYLFYHSGG